MSGHAAQLHRRPYNGSAEAATVMSAFDPHHGGSALVPASHGWRRRAGVAPMLVAQWCCVVTMKPDDQSQLESKRRGLPRIVVLIVLNALIGFALGVAFAAVIILTNVAGLKSLLEASESPFVAILMLFVMCGLTLASLVAGAAIMSMPRD